MTLKEYRTYFLEKLVPLYDILEAESLFHIALEELRGWKRVDLVMHPDEVLSSAEVRRWNSVLEQLEREKPIQYIFGKTFFYGLEFEVNAHTLIPRPETEELVGLILKDNSMGGNITLLDIGTGSGCIAVSLAKNLPEAKVYALDVSAEALAVARSNAARNNAGVTFIEQDILGATALPGRYDIIVSNPPYVRYLEKKEIKKNVLEYEPHLALFVEDDDPLLFYRKIAHLAKSSLNPGGRLYFEINQYLGHKTAELLEQYRFTAVTVHKDLYGNDRMVSCTVPK